MVDGTELLRAGLRAGAKSRANVLAAATTDAAERGPDLECLAGRFGTEVRDLSASLARGAGGEFGS